MRETRTDAVMDEVKGSTPLQLPRKKARLGAEVVSARSEGLVQAVLSAGGLRRHELLRFHSPGADQGADVSQR